MKSGKESRQVSKKGGSEIGGGFKSVMRRFSQAQKTSPPADPFAGNSGPSCLSKGVLKIVDGDIYVSSGEYTRLQLSSRICEVSRQHEELLRKEFEYRTKESSLLNEHRFTERKTLHDEHLKLIRGPFQECFEKLENLCSFGENELYRELDELYHENLKIEKATKERMSMKRERFEKEMAEEEAMNKDEMERRNYDYNCKLHDYNQKVNEKRRLTEKLNHHFAKDTGGDSNEAIASKQENRKDIIKYLVILLTHSSLYTISGLTSYFLMGRTDDICQDWESQDLSDALLPHPIDFESSDRFDSYSGDPTLQTESGSVGYTDGAGAISTKHSVALEEESGSDIRSLFGGGTALQKPEVDPACLIWDSEIQMSGATRIEHEYEVIKNVTKTDKQTGNK